MGAYIEKWGRITDKFILLVKFYAIFFFPALDGEGGKVVPHRPPYTYRPTPLEMRLEGIGILESGEYKLRKIDTVFKCRPRRRAGIYYARRQECPYSPDLKCRI